MVEALTALDALVALLREVAPPYQNRTNTEGRGQFHKTVTRNRFGLVFENPGRGNRPSMGRGANDTIRENIYEDWSWERDAAPSVERWRSTLAEFAARSFGREYRRACREMASMNLAQLDGFGIDAGSHHELLAKLIRVVVEQVDKKNIAGLSNVAGSSHLERYRLLRKALADEADIVEEHAENSRTQANRTDERTPPGATAVAVAAKTVDTSLRSEQPPSPPKPKRLNAAEKAGKAHEYACEKLGRPPQEVKDSETFNWLCENGLPKGDDAIHGLDGYEMPDTLKRWRDCLSEYRTLKGEKKYGTRKGGVETGSIRRKEHL